MRPFDFLTRNLPVAALGRRKWLQLSALGWLAADASGRSLPCRAATGAARETPIRSCILLFHYGGPSQIETFDPKPLAPAEARGEFGTIATSAAGVQICDRLPLTARCMHRVALIRSMHHPMRNHNSAAAEMLTGRTPVSGDLELLADEARSYPTLGSAVNYGLGERAHLLPYVALPYTMYNVVQLPGQTAGILGAAYDRFQMQGDPNSPNFRLTALDPLAGRGGPELQAREALLERLDSEPPGSGERLAERPVSKMQNYQRRALQLLASDEVRRGFDIARERAETRERYGRNLFGQSVLLARRLVEEGVNFVSVFNGQHNGQEANWDSHEKLFPRHGQLLPPVDQAFSALIEDLETRGLLESTLVIWLGEFGRTPKINKNAGRDHWPDCYTVALAGGGVQGGAVYGASDKIAAYPDRDSVSPADLAATIFWRFGIDPSLEMHDQTGRPFRLADGQPLSPLFG